MYVLLLYICLHLSESLTKKLAMIGPIWACFGRHRLPRPFKTYVLVAAGYPNPLRPFEFSVEPYITKKHLLVVKNAKEKKTNIPRPKRRRLGPFSFRQLP
jgi:hypothetical protein